MIHAEAQFTVDRPVEQVFAFIADGFFTNYPKWAPNLCQLKQTSDGELRAGTTGVQIREDFGKRSETTFVVETYEPGHHFGMRSLTGPIPLISTYTFTANDKQTTVDYALEMYPAGMIRLMEPVMGPGVKKEVCADIVRLKHLLQTTDNSPALP